MKTTKYKSTRTFSANISTRPLRLVLFRKRAKSILVNGIGRKILKKGMVFRFGPMVANMKASGWITLPTVMDDSYLLMATYMSENGKMIRRMGTVTIIIRRVHTIRAIGLRINNMDMAGRSGPTKAHMKVVTRAASKKARAISSGLMVRVTRGHGAIIECMERAFSSGLTGESTKATIKLTKNTASEFTVGQTEENMKVIFQGENNMEKEFIHRQTKINNSASGMVAKKSR